jgi:uncharacterized protein DUF1217
MTAAAPSLGLPIVDYQLAIANQAQLQAQFEKSTTTSADIAGYQAGVSKIKTVDALLNNYKVLNVALTAYGMQDAINQKGLLKQLLTQDPTQKTSLAQRLGKANYLAFAQAYRSLSTDGGVGLSSAASINTTAARYTNAQFQQWMANRSNDPALATALTARTTLQDAVNVTNVGALFTKYQQTGAMTQATTYYQNNIGAVKSPADLIADPKLLNFALAAYGIDPASIPAATVQTLLTQSPAIATSIAANNPAYLPFANAFSSLFYDGGAKIHATAAINDTISRYQQQNFSQALANNTDDQNVALFGKAGANQIAQIKGDALRENGATRASAYYASHIGAANTAQTFMGDTQLVGVALTAYGLGQVSASTLQQLLTQNPDDANSLAQTSPQYTAFAKAFSYYSTSSGRSSDDADRIAAVQGAYQANTLKTVLTNEVSLAQAQVTRNTNVGESPKAPLNLYQMLGDANLSTMILGALGEPAIVGGYDPNQQVEIVTHAGFAPESLNSTAAIDSLIKRYMANVGAQNAPTSPLLTLFGSSPSPGQIVSLDLSSLLGGTSSGDATLSGSPTGYLLNLL